MNKAAQWFRDWMLPLAIVTGISLYLFYYFTPFLKPIGPACHRIASEGQRWVIATLLFFQFVQVSPHDLRLRKWHLGAALFQVLSFVALAAVTAFTGEGSIRILMECAMLCLICPTAAAAGVITRKLDGDLPATMTYVVLMDIVATLLIPFVIPMVRPSADYGFWAYVIRIAGKIFPVLILPCLLAWLIRYTTKKLQRTLMRWSPNAYYIWFFGLTLAMILATRALIHSGLGAGPVACIVLVSMGTCALQFMLGWRLGKGKVESTTAGQALGQKNTGFLIWLGYTYLTPVTSVAGGLYAIWQNLFNSWELYRHEHGGGPSS